MKYFVKMTFMTDKYGVLTNFFVLSQEIQNKIVNSLDYALR